jgi:hypothetical protein
MSCNNNNCGCSSCDQTTINQSSENIVEYTRFAYSSANSAYANAQNAEQSAIDAATTLANVVLKTGDTMTGLLILSGDPAVALGASTKQYTDTRVFRSGDTMTGFLTLNAAPTSNLHATTKLYTDTANALKVSKAGDSMSGALTVNSTITGDNVLSTGSIRSNDSTSGIGYSAGAGSSVTQLISQTTTVTINNICGSINIVSFTPVLNTWYLFTVTNSSVIETDVIIVNQKSGANKYDVIVTNVTNGSFQVGFSSIFGIVAEAPVFNFAVIKSVTT